MSRSISVKKKKKIVYGVQGINFLNSNFTTDPTSLSTESTRKSEIIWGVECAKFNKEKKTKRMAQFE